MKECSGLQQLGSYLTVVCFGCGKKAALMQSVAEILESGNIAAVRNDPAGEPNLQNDFLVQL